MDARKLVRRAERDPWNRLNSILEDADWVTSFCKFRSANLPVLANLRCGAWYVTPQIAKGSCYFKSTDGHTSEWHFSLKRYNLDTILTIQEHGGCVIVDSTRRGKSLPDALSKTVPIWCAVLNAASLRRHGTPAACSLFLSDHVISPSEKEQIADKLTEWTDLLLSSELPIPLLKKPLRPIFVTRTRQDIALSDLEKGSLLDYHPVVLLSASPMVPTPGLDPLHSAVVHSCLNLSKETEALRRQSRYIYVQGSGDDEDMWSFNLTPALFWDPANLHLILRHGEGGEKLENTLKLIVKQSELRSFKVEMENDAQVGDLGIVLGSRPRDHVFSQSERKRYKLIIQADSPISIQDSDEVKDKECCIMKLGISSGKRGLHAFRESIPQVVRAAKDALPGQILLCSQECGPGNDLVGGLAVAILSTSFDENRQLVDIVPELTKDVIKKRLQWIISLLINFKIPSRGHLLRINEVLLSRPYRESASKEEQLLTQTSALSF